MSGWRNDPIKSTGFDAQIKHEDGFELHFYTDRLEAYRAVEKVCQEQIDRKPKTRGDELREMTDEQLADWLCVHIECRNCEADESGNGGCDDYCRAVLLDWLQQEVSDNDQR